MQERTARERGSNAEHDAKNRNNNKSLNLNETVADKLRATAWARNPNRIRGKQNRAKGNRLTAMWATAHARCDT